MSRYIKKFENFSSTNIDDTEDILNKIESNLNAVDYSLIEYISSNISSEDIESIIIGNNTIEEVAKKIQMIKNEGVITGATLAIIKFVIAKKLIYTMITKFPNSAIGRIKQNFNFILDTKGKYVALNIPIDESGNFQKDIIRDIIDNMIKMKISISDIFVGNNRDINKRVIIIKSNNMDNISRIMYDSELSKYVIKYYNGFKLKMEHSNIEHISNDPFLNYFCKKYKSEISPSMYNRVLSKVRDLIKGSKKNKSYEN